ncbi:Uncharacterized protein HZ326_8700 [Fusarium oxysporum f. sp. albedinis]|nr:Uncharacterized protein HZ326_8700 [Fusarium oxysporum f. sp. albedinis]
MMSGVSNKLPVKQQALQVQILLGRSFNIANQPQDGTLPCGAVASLASPLSKLTISTKPQQLRLSNLPP